MNSDRDIIENVLAGNMEEYALLVSRYEKALYGFLYPIVRNRQTAEDIVQEVFVRAYEKLPSLRNSSAFGAWIFQIARREAIRTIKEEKQSRVLVKEYDPNPSNTSTRWNNDRQTLMDALGKLSFKDRKVIILKHFGGYTAQEIADMNGQPAGSITKQLSRAYSRLRKALKEME